MTLYIYRVGWIYPVTNPIRRLKFIKIPSCTRIPLRPVRPVVAGQAGSETNERRLGRTRRGRHTQGCSKVGSPSRTPSSDVETKEEQQQIVDGKKLGQKESKKDKSFFLYLIDWIP